eukprot:COSAG01_NODE_5435_length_4274_cov_79.781032_1_plen_72_part_00
MLLKHGQGLSAGQVDRGGRGGGGRSYDTAAAAAAGSSRLVGGRRHEVWRGSRQDPHLVEANRQQSTGVDLH